MYVSLLRRKKLAHDLRIARRLFLVRTEGDFLFAESCVKGVPRAGFPPALWPVRSGLDFVIADRGEVARNPRVALGLFRLRGAVDYRIAELREMGRPMGYALVPEVRNGGVRLTTFWRHQVELPVGAAPTASSLQGRRSYC
jgi:hypothetical protein